jgi:hypothetical protein
MMRNVKRIDWRVEAHLSCTAIERTWRAVLRTRPTISGLGAFAKHLRRKCQAIHVEVQMRNDCIGLSDGVSSGQQMRMQMAKIPEPLSFLNVGDRLVGRFPLLCAPTEKQENQEVGDEGVIVWPVDGSGKIDGQPLSVKIGLRVS